MTTEHAIYSSLREKLIEHLFIGEVLKTLWQKGLRGVEVLKPEVDSGGYDIVIEHGGVVRHVQLKSSYVGSKTARQKVHVSLANKPSGCVIWVYFDADTLELKRFLWFGGKPGERLPDITDFPIAKHTKGNASGIKLERPNLRVVNKGKFKELESMQAVLYALFRV